ncbi:MAG: hypothetical protein ABI054_14290, partial [Planctomycetota bacterium]
WDETELFDRLRRAWPYRRLERSEFDSVVRLHTQGRRALLHRDALGGKLRATRRAKLVAYTSGGAIPDTAQYRVILEPEGTLVGTIDEDYAVESNGGDVFQLGNASWRVLRVEPGTMRVADAQGAPPSLPFWLGEAPARTQELSAEIGTIREHGQDREWLAHNCGLTPEVAEQIQLYIDEGQRALGAVPTPTCMILERFFDESGGTQLVLHSPFGGRINRALGLALRKRFCRQFGFELQAASNEEAIVLSLGPQHSFPLEEVFDYLHPDSVEKLLTQAVLVSPFFAARWRWNVARSLVVERSQGSKRVPAPIFRMRADDYLVQAFPAAASCGETLPPGDIEVPMEHPIVRQTLHDCLHEAMDLDGLIEVLRGLRAGRIRRIAIDTPEPSAFARSILTVRPYGFLDDAPLEERRTQAVHSRRTLDARSADQIGALDPLAVARVREEAWPDPRDAEEVHEALGWMGYVTRAEAVSWQAWLDALHAQQRVVLDGERWFAVEATRDPKAVLRGRMEALGPVHSDDPLLFELEREGALMRIVFEGRQAWCDRRLLARIQRYTLDALRREIEPVSTAVFQRFLAAWQHVDPEYRLDGPAGVAEVVRQLAGFEAPVGAWERKILAVRVRGYRPEWLDQLGLSGGVAWGRMWGAGRSALRSTPIALLPRDELETWLGLTSLPDETALTWPARTIRDTFQAGGALFPGELEKRAGMLPSDVERGIVELIGFGRLTNDSFAALRFLMRPAWKRRQPSLAAGRWSQFRCEGQGSPGTPDAEFVARVFLRRYGVIFRTVLERERLPIPWRDLTRACRALELRGDIRGGRFVAGYAGEQFALPEAVPFLRRIRRRAGSEAISVSAADPLALAGVLTPGIRVSRQQLGSSTLPS